MTEPAVEKTFVRRLLTWGRTNRRMFPWRETRNPFRILVAEVLLQRSRGKTVAMVYEELFRRWPEQHSMSRARVSSIRSVIRPIGLTRRAETLKGLSTAIEERGRVPRSFEELVQLPGVGPYAANATLAAAFGKRSTTVDGVSARVYRRFFGLMSDAPAAQDRELWRLVAEVTPSKGVRAWNWAVLDLAATVCRPSRPRCPECPLRDACAFYQRV